MYDLVSLGKNAKKASVVLRTLSTAQRNAGLHAIAKRLIDKKADILEANRLDVANAKACPYHLQSTACNWASEVL